MKYLTRTLGIAAASAAVLIGCGGGTPASDPRGTLVEQTPQPKLFSFSNTALTSMLMAAGSSGQALIALSTGDSTLATPLQCGVDVYYYQYNTIDGVVGGSTSLGNPATASGALMVPTGPAANCSGPRPIVEYAHGTNLSHWYNIADLGDSTNPGNSEGLEIAAIYAAQGFIVVAPNYVGYDISTTPFHPYMVASQQSHEMIDALQAGRTALKFTNALTTDNGKLFLTGYSQGGHVALATQREMESENLTVTASSPGSGPYSLAAFMDEIFTGHPDLASPALGTWILNSYEHVYNNIYNTPTDASNVFTTNLQTSVPYLNPAAASASTVNPAASTFMFSNIAPTVPSTVANPIITQTLFNTLVPPYTTTQPPTSSTFANALYSKYFGTSSNALITNSFRANYLADAFSNPDSYFTDPTSGVLLTNGAINTAGMASKSSNFGTRQDAATNDLRGYSPKTPTVLCGGINDPVVFFPVNSGVMQAEWAASPPSAKVATVLNVDSAPLAIDDGFNNIRVLFNNFYSQNAGVSSVSGVSGSQSVMAGVAALGGVGTPAGAAAYGAALKAYHPTVTALTCAVAARSFFSQH